MIVRKCFAWTSVLALFSLGSLGCSSSSNTDSPDAGDEAGIDTAPYEEPDLGDTPAGRVILLKPFHPDTRCFDPPTAIGHPDDDGKGGIAPCGTQERCYVRTDGVAIYAPKDCVHGGSFLFNVTDLPYSDLGPCEPPKHLEDKIHYCPTTSCVFARDVRIDTARGCATAVLTRGCRDVVGAAKGCFCNPSAPEDVFIGFDGTATSSMPTGFTACDASAACKKALAVVDTIAGCPEPIASDAGPDTSSDAADSGTDGGTDAVTDTSTDATDGG